VIFIILFLLTFAVAACTPNVTINYNLPTTVIPGAIETYAIQTMLAKPELVSLVITPTPTQLHTNPSPTSIKDNINQTAANQGILNQNDAEYHQQLITQTPNPTATPLEPCNAGKFIADITIPDDTVLSPGEFFTKTWRIQNVGLCTWTKNYQVVFATGDQLNGPDEFFLTKAVLPGESIDISIKFQAPRSYNCYQGNWLFSDSDGNRFGVGYKANEFFWVAISVQQPGVKRVNT
jgi:hypothetical protein